MVRMIGLVCLLGITADVAIADCTYESRTYGEGAMICQAGLRMECSDKNWYRAGKCDGDYVPVARIHIDEAYYGVMETARRCIATDQVASRCNEKVICTFMITGDKMCPDPAPNAPKHLDVRYSCGKNKFKVIQAHGTELNIGCVGK